MGLKLSLFINIYFFIDDENRLLVAHETVIWEKKNKIIFISTNDSEKNRIE